MLLERETELATLAELIGALGAGAGGGVLVEAAPGLGKTALLDAAAATARSKGVTVLRAGGSELEAQLAFGAVRQLFGGVARHPRREALLTGAAALAAPVLGIVPETPSAQVADPLYGLFWLTAGLSEQEPLLLVVDDLHWLDDDSARFVAYLLPRLEGLPVLVLAAARPLEPGASAGAAAARASFRVVLRPAPLTAPGVAELLPHRVASELHRATGGNPLLLAEVESALAEAPPGTPIDELGPPAVARLVLDRVVRISPEAIALAHAVALFPDGAELGDVATVAALDPDAAAAAADALVAARVLRPGDQLVFLHPVLRNAVYGDLGVHARRRGHLRAVQQLKARGAAVEAVAAQLLAAAPDLDPDNVTILRSAADDALSRVAPRAAARYLARAVAEGAARGEQLRSLLLDLGRLQLLTGDAAAPASLRRALELSDSPSHRVEGATQLAAALFMTRDYAGLRSVAESVEGLASTDDRLALDMLVAESAWITEDWDTCFSLIERVPPDLPGDTPAQRLALVQLASVRLLRGAPVAGVVEMLRRAVGERGSDALVAGLEVGDPLGWLIICDALDEASTLAEQRLTVARETGNDVLYAATQNAVGWIAMMRGDLLAAEAAYRLGMTSPGVPAMYRLVLAVNHAEATMWRGAWDEAEAVLAEGADIDPGSSDLAIRHAEIATWQGRYAEALPTFELRLRADSEKQVTHPATMLWLMDYLDCLAGLGRRDEAIALASDLVRRSEQTGGPAAHVTFLGALGRVTGDVEDLRRAQEAANRTPFRWLAARADLELGAALRRSGARVEARDHLRAALDYADRQHIQHFAHRAREELRLAGARPRRAVLSGVDALTPAEDRIVRLAAEGRSNKDVAQHLFLTVKTVEMTLVRAYRKLGVSTRSELESALARS